MAKIKTSSAETVAALLKAMIAAAAEAELLILAAHSRPVGEDGTEIKLDGTPVTKADKQSEAIIPQSLEEAFPHIPLIGEESVNAGVIPALGDGPFFLIDPLDGTKEFEKRGDDFTINIAFIEDGRPVIGVVLAPAHGELFTGSPMGAYKARRDEDGAYGACHVIAARSRPVKPVVIVSASRRPPELIAYLDSLEGPFEERQIGSLLKVCRIAEGKADIYPCPMSTSVWDTAASHAVLEAAGGRLCQWKDGAALQYDGKRFCTQNGFLNPHFIAFGAP
ncbi:3'(2'),5'-bisphosphate nucleotidase [Rhizobium sp. PP-F2F-G48]|uniref:3'(2'),5'-bisphosphate nucleotidase CysQ family protein n=1 Tax=Rhizobium sp. PP-F2F-G48 TaxID=2135651 RepID=UPI00104ACD53|nr:3'(2'),5'-bisphosphate nucleotidase CysQ [Rhizobium sp. PP-F2F-G48]TCM51131.1 3'(2'),5'-bisphosphate nucleotidase [Rhizobium sp. PP-F2F-G48]